MPVKFEWQTDREHEWTDEAESAEPGFSWRRHWRWGLALLLLLVVVIGVSFALLNQRAATTENTMADDVLASHRLVQQAVTERDSELFALMLFPYDRDWGELQQKLYDRRLFLDRVPLGLWAMPHLTQSEPVVTMAPDLQTAVVTTQIPYIIEKSATMTETVVLENTAVYEYTDSQWLLAPLPDDDSFWGSNVTERGQILTLIYPARDAEIGQRLVVDLDKALEALCQLENVACLPTFRLRLTLEADASQLLALSNAYRNIFPRRASGGALSLTLPAPTLVGRSVDEAGYQALVRGYAGWVTAVLVNEFNRAEQPSHTAILSQLAQIDLRPPPANRERTWQIQPPPPIPWPEQDILMLCGVSTNSLPMEVWRYELAESNWIDESAAFADADPSLLETPGGFLLLPMPGDDGAAAISFDFNDLGDGRVFLWRDGVVTPLVAAAPTGSWLPTNYILPGSAKDRFVIFYYQQNDELTNNYIFDWLDLAHCPGPSCQLQTGDALPLWSPDEQKTVLFRTSVAGPPTLAWGDANNVETADIGPGWSPVWVNDAAFAYLRPDASLDSIAVGDLTGAQLALAEWPETAVAPTSQTLLTSYDLLAALPMNGRPTYLLMYTLIINPSRPEQWFIQATTSFNSPDGRDYLFAYDRQSGEVSLILALDSRTQGGIQLEGNGRYLVVITEENGNPIYMVHDLESGRTTSYPFSPFYIGVDWSADGQWLVILDEDMMRLIVPSARYERTIFQEMEGCGTVTWVNR